MTPEETMYAAKALIEKNNGKLSFDVSIDNPNDCARAINAFKKLGCKVKVSHMGAILTITAKKLQS